MSVFEAFMLLCFGVSWPISIAKTVRSGKVSGKSPLFLGIVCLGYLSGILHKVLVSCDWVIVLYVINLAMVAVDLGLYYYYLSLGRRTAAGTAGCAEPAVSDLRGSVPTLSGCGESHPALAPSIVEERGNT